eukprot:264865-Amphidinium_carterae.1
MARLLQIDFSLENVFFCPNLERVGLGEEARRWTEEFARGLHQDYQARWRTVEQSAEARIAAACREVNEVARNAESRFVSSCEAELHRERGTMKDALDSQLRSFREQSENQQHRMNLTQQHVSRVEHESEVNVRRLEARADQ